MDQRERFADDEEALRAAVAGILKHHHANVVAVVTQASDGRTLVAQPVIKRRDTNPDGSTSYVDHPLLLDVPIQQTGAGGSTLTFSPKPGDEIATSIMSRSPDPWFQNGGTQQPTSTRTFSLSDAVAHLGLRSMPRQLEAVSTSSAQLRDDAGHHVIDHDPAKGVTHFSADPSTPVASAAFTPFTMASKFVDHAVQGTMGLLARAVSGGTTHDHGIDFANGPFMRAANALHSVLCHPSNGASLNAQNLLHSVTAGPIGAIMSAFGGKHTVSALASGLSLQSAAGISLSCPPGSLSLPFGGVGGGALAAGAASGNVGALGGDLSGTLPSPTVTGLHVDFSKLPAAASDSAAATAGVAIGALYRDTSVSAGKSYLAVRMS